MKDAIDASHFKIVQSVNKPTSLQSLMNAKIVITQCVSYFECINDVY